MPPRLVQAAALGLSYRPRTPDDLPFLFSVYAATREEELAQTGWPIEMRLHFLRQQFEAQRAHYDLHYPAAEWLVIEAGGEDVGRLYLEEWADQLRIIDIALLPAARRQGFGTAILNDVCAMASAAGKKVSIHVEKNNPAMALYRTLGFVAVADKGVYDLLERPADDAGQRSALPIS
ncbi:GNAT family N-acetyltransferase [Sphingosinicella sp. BN140058]|uniref:GNAT family N-acetyltransferase n=1 Tax=Sphingosinicella sp. BN140058 TaxID=1892855 RepID=UPI001010B8C1|nr:GNAT family N-acetyltransferase [Sphingosinicella sp. BN140058]QAY75201.1 N-acetyltransferase [Sphingosinicella sp. BN140058]